MKSLRSLPLIVPLLGLYACSSPAGSRVDSGGGDTAAPADTGPDLVAPGMKCTGDINLSCFNFMAAVPNCSEYANADDAKIAEVTASCASVQGDLALGKCPPGNTAGCGYSTEVPCRHLWYYGFPTDLLQQVCGSNLILP
jgi:hypothetical protein